MHKGLHKIKPHKKQIYICTPILVFSVIFLLSFFSAPIADDWGLYTSAQKHDFFSYLHLTYVAHTARFGQWGLLWIGFRLFGLAFTRIYPLFSFLALILILTLILLRSHLLSSPKKALFFSSVAGAAYLCCCPSVFDTFLWLDSNLAHFTSILFSLLIILEIITLTQKMDNKHFIIRFISLLLICFAAQFFSELTGIINIAFMGLFCVLLFFIRKKSKQAKLLLRICLPSLIVLIVGFLILYYSPARIARSEYNHSSFGKATIKESINTFSTFFSHVPLLAYALIVFAAFSFSNCVKNTFLNKRGIALSLLVLIATTICSFVVICYAQGFAVPRTLTMTAFGFSFSMIYILAFIIERMTKKISNFANAGFFVSFATVLVLSAIFVPPYIEKIATRHYLANQRDISVREQIESGAEIVEISELPILVYGTAEDFYYFEDPESGESYPIWVADQYVDYIRGENETPQYILKKVDNYSSNYRD